MDFLKSTRGKFGAVAIFLFMISALVLLSTSFTEGQVFETGEQASVTPTSASNSTVGETSDSSWFFQGTLLGGQEGCFDSPYDNCYLNTNEYQRASVEALMQSETPETITVKDGVWLVENGESVEYECGEPEPVGSMYHDTYIFHGDASFSWDDNGDGVPDSTAPEPSGDYRELSSNEGEFEIDWEQPKELNLVCLAYQEHWGGEWVWTYQGIEWDDPYKVASDSDNDGVYDYNDNCPNTAGSTETGGCPDSDGDGLRDSKDAFPNDAECQKDSDGDGVCDNNDAAPNDPNCQTDTDGDGVCDSRDAFPNDPNCQEDSDGDGVCDSEDQFPNDPSRQYDSDGDGIADTPDECPEEPGLEEKNGCPNQASKIDSINGERNVTVGENVEYSVDINNPDGDSTSVSWSNGETGESASYSWNSTGAKTVSVTIDDGYEQRSGELNVQVGEKQGLLEQITGFFGNIWSVLTFSG